MQVGSSVTFFGLLLRQHTFISFHFIILYYEFFIKFEVRCITSIYTTDLYTNWIAESGYIRKKFENIGSE